MLLCTQPALGQPASLLEPTRGFCDVVAAAARVWHQFRGVWRATPPPRHGACLVSLARHSPPASYSTSSSLVPFVQACEWVRSKEGVEEHLPGLPDFPELPSEFRLPFPLPALPLLRPEWDSYVRSIRKWPHPLPSHSAHAQIHVSPLPFPPQGSAHGRDDSYQWSLLHCCRERC